MSWDGGRSGSGAVIVRFRNGDRIARVSPDKCLIFFVLWQRRLQDERFADSGLIGPMSLIPGGNTVSVIGLHMNLQHHTRLHKMD